MTLAECKAAAASLAFAEDLSDIDESAENMFFSSLNRALTVADGARPRRASLTLDHRSPFSSGAQETEDGAYILYELTAMAPDLACLTAPPALFSEEAYYPLSDGYMLEDGVRLYLLRSRPGVYRLEYRRRPPTVSADTPEDTVLSLDDEVCQLAVLLVAHDLLLDDDPDKAQVYLTLFRERYALLRGEAHTLSPALYRSVNDW